MKNLMIRYMLLGGCLLVAIPVNIAATSPVQHPLPSMQMQNDKTLKAFPQPKAGQKQFVISVPPRTDKKAFRVGLMVGRMELTDGVNTVRISGQLNEKNVPGWGYNYYEVERANGPSMSTRIGVPPGTPQVMRYVSLQEKLVRYNSRLPIVIYAPENFEVRYRVYTAGAEQSAPFIANDTHPQNLATNEVFLNTKRQVQLPTGSMATIRLYDSLLMDTDSTYAVHTIPVSQLPTNLPMPQVTNKPFIAGPAVGVTIRDINGHLLFWNDTSTTINPTGQTQVSLVGR